MTKKIFAILMALVLTLAMCTTAMATAATDETPAAVNPVITKEIVSTNQGSSHGADTFTFTFSSVSVAQAAAGTTAPAIPSMSVDFTEADAKKDMRLDISSVTFPSVGVYTYKVTESQARPTAGMICSDPVYLVVTVINGTNGLEVGGLHFYKTAGDYSSKISEIINTYNAGTLSITKNVTGNMGDKTEYFKINVTLTVPEGKTAKGNVTVSALNNTENPTSIEYGVPTVFYLKSDETLTLGNIPYDVTYSVSEDNYSGESYTTTYKLGEATVASINNETIKAASQSIIITNDKQQSIDTGISLDSLPYIIVLGAALIGLAVVIVKKRMASSDDDQ